ncbi:MAG: hypothetical protein ACM3VZ_04525 [Acidobacteriota bacterium]
MPLLKDLIAIPERVHQGDFVLQLSKGVTEPEQTLRDYVVTPQLVDAFANALGFIQQAVQTGGSIASFSASDKPCGNSSDLAFSVAGCCCGSLVGSYGGSRGDTAVSPGG